MFDPFVGSGTVIRVATRLQRKGVGCDLNWEYLSKQADKRMRDVQVEMQYPELTSELNNWDADDVEADSR